MNVPHGRAAILRMYGNPVGTEGRLSKAWEAENIVPLSLPWPMRLAWETQSKVHTIRCHRVVAGDLASIFYAMWDKCRADVKERDGYDMSTAYYDAAALRLIQARGWDLYGGCFNFRQMRGGSKISTHAWGIAIDLDPERNGLGDTTPAMDPFVVDLFEDRGWLWGGRWEGKRCDGMHFQRCTGY